MENTQFALIATVHKLYAMVRNGQQWDLGEPELNDRGQPVIHNIASKLGCIRPNSDMDLPVHSIFPEDEAGLAELARQLEEQQKANATNNNDNNKQEGDSSRADRASSSEVDHSDFEDYRKTTFNNNNGTALTMSPASLNYGGDFDIATATPTDSFPSQSPVVPPTTFPTTWLSRPTSMDFTAPDQLPFLSMEMLNQGLYESNFGTIKPHVLSCPNPEVMMGMGDPMMYSGYDADMRM